MSCSNREINQINTLYKLEQNMITNVLGNVKNDIRLLSEDLINKTLKKYEQERNQDGENKLDLVTVKRIRILSGGVKLVKFKKTEPLSDYRLLCDQKEIPLFQDQGYAKAYISESYFSKRQSFSCFIIKKKTAQKKLMAKIQVKKKYYRTIRLRFKRRQVILNPKDLKRALQEKKLLDRVYSSSHSKPYFYSAFILPLKSKITSSYGTVRIYNRIKRKQHLGMDFRARTGTPIPAANSGKVVLAKNLFFAGNAVIIDHGIGIFTFYAHLSKLKVKKGEKVLQNQILGLAGATGRVRGPHLHWGVRIQAEWINGHWLAQAGY